jgi:hypothetical protein
MRRRSQTSATLRLGTSATTMVAGAETGTLATRSSEFETYQRAGLLHLLCPDRDDACRVGRRRGLRWTIETCFEMAKDELGLDHCEARSWHAWHRHMSLVMTALAFLAKLRADLPRSTVTGALPSKRNERSPSAIALAS